MKRITLLALAFLVLSACQSEQESKDEQLRKKIDDAVKLSGNEYGHFKLISKGAVLDTIISVEGNERFQATLDQDKNVVTAEMASKDGNIQIEYGFEGTELGYRPVDGKNNFIHMSLSLDSLQISDAEIEKSKVAVRRVQPGNFTVGSYTGVMTIDGKMHTVRVEFETALKELPPVQ